MGCPRSHREDAAGSWWGFTSDSLAGALPPLESFEWLQEEPQGQGAGSECSQKDFSPGAAPGEGSQERAWRAWDWLARP